MLKNGKREIALRTKHITNIAQAFNRFYHECPIIVDDEETQKSRLLLVYAAKNVINIGLSLLGIESPEKM